MMREMELLRMKREVGKGEVEVVGGARERHEKAARLWASLGW